MVFCPRYLTGIYGSVAFSKSACDTAIGGLVRLTSFVIAYKPTHISFDNSNVTAVPESPASPRIIFVATSLCASFVIG